MTSSESLRLMARDYGLKPEPWHYKLAELTTAMTVLGLFRHATFETSLLSEAMVITDDTIRDRARRFMREVASARGCAVTIKEPTINKASEAWGRA